MKRSNILQKRTCATCAHERKDGECINANQRFLCGEFKVHWSPSISAVELYANRITRDSQIDVVRARKKIKQLNRENFALRSQMPAANAAICIGIPDPSDATVASLSACATMESAVRATIQWCRIVSPTIPADRILQEGEVAVLSTMQPDRAFAAGWYAARAGGDALDCEIAFASWAEARRQESDGGTHIAFPARPGARA